MYGDPCGKPKGTKGRFGHKRSAKCPVLDLLDRFGTDIVLLDETLVRGLQTKALASYPSLQLVLEQHQDAPEQNVNLKDKIVLAPHD